VKKKTEEATTSQSNCATDVDREVISGDENDAAVIGGESSSSLTNVERTPLGHLSARQSSSLVKPASKKRSARRGWTMYLEDDQFNQFLSLAIQRSIQSETNVDKEFASTSHMVDLMRAFNDAKAAIGCPIKAAYHCPIFCNSLTKMNARCLRSIKRNRRRMTVIAIPILKNIS
jgi:hypothetical protein